MKSFLNKIREKDTSLSLKNKIINTFLILIAGIILGLISKYLDNLAIDSTVWYHKIIETLDLNNFFSEMAIWIYLAITISIFSKTPLRASLNVFVFFLGMNISYHLYTIIFSGFNPLSYMMIWYTLTLVSPLLAYIVWYSNSTHILSTMLNAVLLYVMISLCFSIGMWYFDFKGILYFITFLATLLTVYTKPKQLTISLIIGLILSFLIRVPYFG